ncbi:protein BNIP5 [Orcinus orca]|uniref:protein BNIP5 n=1 Tax=Orcinus orca TaxID=9733 RepID=UPI0021126557|nr:protein BNIP5 [Orcinus orca]
MQSPPVGRYGPKLPWDRSDFHGLSAMELPRGPRKPLSGRRARSLDRLQNPQKDSESRDCWCISRPTSPSRRLLRRTASDGAKCPKSPAQSAEAQRTTAAALSPEETRKFLPSEHRPPQDTKKDKAQGRAQQGWLKTMMNFVSGTSPEEPKEKTNKRAKGKEGFPEPAETPETPGEPAPRKKAHSKKASRKKHGHKKHGAEETKGIRDQEAKGQEAKMAGASCCEEADLGPAAGGGEVSDLPQFSLLEGGGAGVRKVSSQATGRQGEEELGKPDSESESSYTLRLWIFQASLRRTSPCNVVLLPHPTFQRLTGCICFLPEDTIIQKIAGFLKKVGDQWEEEVRGKLSAQMPRGLLPSPPPPCSSPPVLLGLSAPLLQALSPPLPGAALKPLVAPQLLLGELSPLLKVRGLTQFLSSPPQQHQASQPEVAPQNPAPGFRKKPQERKSSLKKAFSHKKHGFEEPKRAQAADVSSPESRPPKRPSFLPLCVGGHRPSSSSSPGVEKPEFQETLSTDGGDPSPFELSNPAGSRGPEEDLQLDRASEFKEFIQEIMDLLQDAEEQGGDKQLQVQEAQVAVGNLAPTSRKKSQEKKSSFRKAFSHKKHGLKEPKRGAAAGAASPESRPSKRPSFLPLCVGGHRHSISSNPDPEDVEFQESSPAEGGPVGSSEAPSQARSHKPEAGPQPHGANESKELIIQKLVALLQEVDGQLGEQFRQHPNFKKFFYKLPDSSLRNLVATLRPQEAHSTEPKRPYPFVFGLANKCAGSNHQAVLSLTGLHYRRPSFSQFPYREDQQVRKRNMA